METGCAVAALGSEMPRQAPEVRRAATRRIKEMIDLVARQLPDWGQRGARHDALVTVATMVGALVLARAVDDPRQVLIERANLKKGQTSRFAPIFRRRAKYGSRRAANPFNNRMLQIVDAIRIRGDRRLIGPHPNHPSRT